MPSFICLITVFLIQPQWIHSPLSHDDNDATVHVCVVKASTPFPVVQPTGDLGCALFKQAMRLLYMSNTSTLLSVTMKRDSFDYLRVNKLKKDKLMKSFIPCLNQTLFTERAFSGRMCRFNTSVLQLPSKETPKRSSTLL